MAIASEVIPKWGGIKKRIKRIGILNGESIQYIEEMEILCSLIQIRKDFISQKKSTLKHNVNYTMGQVSVIVN